MNGTTRGHRQAIPHSLLLLIALPLLIFFDGAFKNNANKNYDVGAASFLFVVEGLHTPQPRLRNVMSYPQKNGWNRRGASERNLSKEKIYNRSNNKKEGDDDGIISLSTTTSVRSGAGKVHAFLATPANWPKIVLSSVAVRSVEDIPSKKSKSTRGSLSQPFRAGERVDEVFGLPPVLPLEVRWTCTESKPATGRLVFKSADGLNGVASDCKMEFNVAKDSAGEDDGDEMTMVTLTMEYRPTSPLAVLAIPVLALDNALSLKVFLPSVVNSAGPAASNVDTFRRLMGGLYGGAGLAHLWDCTVGPSLLLTTTGAPPFDALPPLGQAYALVWCLVGPLSFGLSWWPRSRSSPHSGELAPTVADVGLILYGLVEVIGAFLVSSTYGSGPSGTLGDPFLNAVLTQAVVALSWFYSSRREAPATGQR